MLLRGAKRRDVPALLAMVWGAGLFLLVFGPSTLNPTYDSWIFNGYIGVDILQHYAGWVAFRAGEWTFPLTFTSLLSWPMGGAASLADCVPLFAIPAKLLSPLLPETFQYFGLFTLFCMAMGGYAGAKLLGTFGFSSVGRVLGSSFFAASPILLERAFQHTALAAHFIVVLVLYLYCKAQKQRFQGRALWGFVPLAAVAAATHVYFVPMVLALAFATAVEALVATKQPGRLWFLAASVAASLLTAFALGFFSSADYVAGGYGQFGMNLNAFWNPASWNWATWDAGYQNLHWSRLLPMLPVVGDSLGSFSYLGLGVLLGLLFTAIWLAAIGIHVIKRQGLGALCRRLLGLFKRHMGLVFSLLCLMLFAISNVVTANSRTLFVVPLPQNILRFCDMFRSSGRLIWPVYYLLVALSLWGTAKLAKFLFKKAKPKYLSILALVVLFLVQAADLSGVLWQKRDYFSSPVIPQSYAAPDGWDRIAQKGRVLYTLELTEDRPMALRAALAGMPTNYYLLARGTPNALAQDMQATQTALLAGHIPHKNIVYLTRDETLAAQLAQSLAGQCDIFPCVGYTVFLPLEGTE